MRACDSDGFSRFHFQFFSLDGSRRYYRLGMDGYPASSLLKNRTMHIIEPAPSLESLLFFVNIEPHTKILWFKYSSITQ